MRYSPESLEAFLQAVETGSFSAAARKLKKSQSTISSAIANLEADLGVTLFDRHARQPTLTPHGQRVLPYVQAIFAASERLDEVSVRLADNVEPRLTFVLSDMWQTAHHESILQQFSGRYPDIEFECIIAEDEDVIDSLADWPRPRRRSAGSGKLPAGYHRRPPSGRRRNDHFHPSRSSAGEAGRGANG